MRKNGFTLIELLAVIVILAIIALIATPIILGIINDAREESQERSVELYASAVRNGIAAYQLREGKEVAAGTYTSEELPFDVEYDGDVECTTIELYEDGGVYVAGCTVNDLAVEYTYGTKQESVAKLSEVCTIAADSTVTGLNAGAKYNCTVDPNKEAYTFYVLTSAGEDATSVNLIMDSNINISGEAVKTGVTDTGLVAWLSAAHYAEAGGVVTDEMLNDEGPCQYGGICVLNSYGPVTAMEYLQTATAGWKNVNVHEVSMFTDDNKGEHEMAQTFIANARLPYYREISNVGSTTPWLLDNLEDGGYQTNVVSGVYGYWTLSSYAFNTTGAWFVSHYGSASNEVNIDGSGGVRPVINLSI